MNRIVVGVDGSPQSTRALRWAAQEADAVVGREAELGAVERFLDATATGPSALVIEGEPGLGKTTVWFEALRAAAARSYRVLRARPAENEAKLSYAALSDLVGGAFDDARAGRADATDWHRLQPLGSTRALTPLPMLAT